MISYIAAHRLTAGAKVRSYLRKVPGGESISSRLLDGNTGRLESSQCASPPRLRRRCRMLVSGHASLSVSPW